MNDFFDLVVIFWIGACAVLTVILCIFAVKAMPQGKCSDPELNIVIEKVQSCKKQNVICAEKEIDRILKEICGK